jgi:hypothetical protein
MIRYFVSYVYAEPYGHGIGYGWCDIPRSAPIRNGTDLKAVIEEIERSGIHRVTVLNWRRFEEVQP